MIKRGLKHVKDIRLNKVIPDEVAPLSVKDPISSIMGGKDNCG
jgi:hypothetical protein